MIVIDTHVLVWWASGSKLLSATAAKLIRDTLDNDGKVIVSCISVWEISMLIEKGRLALTMDVAHWLHEITQIDGIHFMPVDNEIAIQSTTLPGKLHKDPADRMIVATARKLAMPLVTADEKIRAYKQVKTVW